MVGEEMFRPITGATHDGKFVRAEGRATSPGLSTVL